MNLPVSRHGVEFETVGALSDVQQIVAERGNAVTIYLRKESNVQRDTFGSIKSRSTQFDTLTFYAYPVRYNVTEKYMEKVGLREKTQVVIHTAMLDWNEAGYPLEQLKDLDMIRMTVVLDSVKYEIRDKSFYSQFAATYLYLVLGLNRI